MIVDQEQYDAFIEWLPELQHDETYFLSLSARNKYLTDEEREFYGLGRTEMFSRFVARDKEMIKNHSKPHKSMKRKSKRRIKKLHITISDDSISPSSSDTVYHSRFDNLMKINLIN